MAVRTRTPRQSSGSRQERKAAATAAQAQREQENLDRLAEAKATDLLQGKDGSRVRPSKALRKARRAQERAEGKA